MSTPATQFALDGVSVEYANGVASQAALDVDRLRIARAEAVALVGPSGAGKTTLLRVLGAALRPTAGSVEIDGQRAGALGAAELRRVRARIGFVHQSPGLVPNLRVVHNVIAGAFGHMSFAASLRALLVPKANDVERAHAILDRVGIGELLYQRSDRLSGGQLQRVAIARALFQQPDALLADEPVSSVDPARARDTLGLLLELSRERDITLIASLHNLELARELFPRVIGLRNGRLVLDGPPDSFREDDVTRLFELEEGPGTRHVP